MAIHPHRSENEEIPPGARDREYADPLPPATTAGDSRDGRTEWPIFTIGLTVVMAVVVALSTPWAAGVRNFLFPPHPRNALENRTSPAVTALPEAVQSEPGDGRTTPGLAPRDRVTDTKRRTNELGGKPLAGAPDTDRGQEMSRASFVLLLNGREKVVRPGDTLSIARSDQLVIHDYKDMDQEDGAIKVNLVGFVGNKMMNDGEDRGYLISPVHLLPRHSVERMGRIYRIEATSADLRIAEMFIRIGGD